MANKKKLNTNSLIMALVYIVIGVLLCIFRSGMLNIFLTVAGALLIIYGIYELIQKQFLNGVLLTVFGIVLIVGGWTILDIILLIMGIVLAVYGAYELIMLLSKKSKVALSYVDACITLIIGILFIAMKWAMLDWFIVVLGIVAIVNGVIILVNVKNY